MLGVAAVQEEALGGALMGGETLEDKTGEREVSATGERAEQTFFRRSAWTTSEREVLGSRTLYLLPCSLAVTRKRTHKFRRKFARPFRGTFHD